MKKIIIVTLIMTNQLHAAYSRMQLLNAARDGNVSTLEELLGDEGNLGSSIDVNTEENGNTALILAARGGHALALQTILTFRPNLDVVDNNHETALMHGVKNGNYEIVKILLKAGADPNVPDVYGKSPLYYAELKFKNSNPKLISLLKRYGARNH